MRCTHWQYQATHRWVDVVDRCRNAGDGSSQGAVAVNCGRRKCASSTTSRRRATEELHHEPSQPTCPLRLCHVPRRNLHLWLPPVGNHGLRLRRELLLRRCLRLCGQRLLRQGLQLRQELMTNPSRGAPRDTSPIQERPMKNFLQRLARLLTRPRARNVEEQYLSQAVDAQDLQVRLAALERARP